MRVKLTTTKTANGDQRDVFTGRDQVIPGIQDQLVDHPGAGLDQLVYIFIGVEFLFQAFIRITKGALECPDELIEGLLTGNAAQ